MRILVRSMGTHNWEIIDSAEYHGETELQELLAEAPFLIPMGVPAASIWCR